jgi:hypothetical protein
MPQRRDALVPALGAGGLALRIADATPKYTFQHAPNYSTIKKQLRKKSRTGKRNRKINERNVC